MKFAIISALASNRVIGRDGKLPWHLPKDLKRFKRLTTGHPVLMGRKTYEALGTPLKGRRNVVLTAGSYPDVETCTSIAEARSALHGEDLVFVIGGGQIYAQFIEQSHFLYLTILDRPYEGDAYFPPYEHLIGTMYEPFHVEQCDGFVFSDYKRTEG
ncbi:MAG: dihydrofolate reductase [Ignavibacteria bacterium]|nr:dihydrofolate reductase [Ignavibacteria bacterium]